MASGLCTDAETTWIPHAPLTEEVRVRARKSVETFHQKFGTFPQFFIRVPGRVNLIGEHIDYCGYGVFPMAIEQDVLVSLNSSANGSSLKLTNVGAQYEDFECQLNQIRSILDSRVSGKSPGWYFYFLSGVQGILDEFSLLDDINNQPRSLEICVDGTIPPCSGLSSSSAIVCAAALSTLVANNIQMDKSDLASLCAKSERFVGTEGGGMDQAIAMLATAGTAQLIEFVPSLLGVKVKLPSTAIFVIANCLAEANKAASATFNTRVAECRLATWILGKRSNVEDCFQFNRLKDLQLSLGFSSAEMKTLINKELHREPYGAVEIAGILGLSVEELSGKPLMNRIPFHTTEFSLYNRAKHVIEESERVYKFRAACLEGSLEEMGTLMNASHWSLSKTYDCSHPLLDNLVELSKGITYGARLTGAGWGGCMVALLDKSQLSNYLEVLRTKFYLPIQPTLDSCHVFVTSPGSGATVYQA